MHELGLSGRRLLADEDDLVLAHAEPVDRDPPEHQTAVRDAEIVPMHECRNLAQLGAFIEELA